MRWTWISLLCALPALAAPVTFQWDAAPGYPPGVTYELQANGSVFTGITGTSITVDLPGPGQPLGAEVRAISPDPVQWSNSSPAFLPQPAYVPGATVPSGIVNLVVGKTTSGGGVMAAPTFVSSISTTSPATESVQNSSTTRTTASYSPASGAILVAGAVSEDSGTKTLADPAISGGATWTQRALDNTSSKSSAALATATAVGGSITSTVTSLDAVPGMMGMVVATFTGSDGIGATPALVKSTTGFPSMTLTTTQANSAIVAVVSDWAAVTGTSTFSNISGSTPVELMDFANGSNYGFHVVYWPDVGAAGSKTVAMSAPSGMNWMIAAVEVKGSAGAPSARGEPNYLPPKLQAVKGALR